MPIYRSERPRALSDGTQGKSGNEREYHTVDKFDENEWTALVDDPRAAGGKAVRVRGEGLKLPIQTSRRTIRPADVTGAGYHWYRLGKVSFNYGDGAFVFKPNTVHAYAFEYGSFEVWVSLRFAGPAFLHGGKQGINTAWLERMILVRSGTAVIKGNLSLPRRWTVFGPLDESAAVLASEVLRTVPRKMTVAGKVLTPYMVTTEKGQLDLATLLGGTTKGKTAYVFVPFHLDAAQELTFGIGADWWFQAWLDGHPLLDTLAAGNVAWPPSPADHVRTLPVAKGAHVLTVRFISGTGSSVLAVAGPDGLRAQAKH